MIALQFTNKRVFELQINLSRNARVSVVNNLSFGRLKPQFTWKASAEKKEIIRGTTNDICTLYNSQVKK